MTNRGSFTVTFLLAITGAMLLTGCVNTRSGASSPTASPATTEGTAQPTPPTVTVAKGTATTALDHTLTEILAAENRTAASLGHGLQVQNDSVKVIIELEDDQSLPQQGVTELEGQFGQEVEAYVAFDQLRWLAAHDNVRFIRPPQPMEAE